MKRALITTIDGTHYSVSSIDYLEIAGGVILLRNNKGDIVSVINVSSVAIVTVEKGSVSK